MRLGWVRTWIRPLWFAALTVGAVYFAWQCWQAYHGTSLALPDWYLSIVMIAVARAGHEIAAAIRGQTAAIQAKERAIRDLVRVLGRTRKGDCSE